jgi:molybdopterin synthase catalytic subunit
MASNHYAVTAKELGILLKAFIATKSPAIIKGAPGIGKTSIVSQVAKETGAEFVPMYPAISSPTDPKGQPVYDREEKRAKFVPYGNLERFISAQKPMVVLLDDFGQATPAVQASFMHLLGERRIGDHAVSEHVVFYIATNDKNQNAAVNGVIEPMKSRSHTIVELVPDVESWLSWAVRNQIRPEVTGFIRLRPEMLWDFKPTSDLVNSPSPRTAQHVSIILGMGMPRDLQFKAIVGAAGEGFATEFAGFISLFETLRDPDEILRDPMGVEIPEDNPSVVYAYCAALSARVSKKNIQSITSFASRLPPEFAVKLVQYDCLSKDPSIAETEAYTKWAVENHHWYK